MKHFPLFSPVGASIWECCPPVTLSLHRRLFTFRPYRGSGNTARQYKSHKKRYL